MPNPSNNQKSAINQFFASIKQLRETGVIRSNRFLGDLAEFLCAKAFNIQLESNQRAKGLDGTRNGISVQIKYHGGKTTTANLGNPNDYEELYLVVGPESVFRKKVDSDDFLVYKFTKAQVRRRRTSSGKYQVSKNGLPNKPVRRICLG